MMDDGKEGKTTQIIVTIVFAIFFGCLPYVLIEKSLTQNTMEILLTTGLLMAGLACFWLFFKSIDLFENI